MAVDERMKGNICVANIENGRPTVDQALGRLKSEITGARLRGCRVLKVIHGYGSSGRGGNIRKAVKETLAKHLQDRIIKDFLAGEDWTIFNSKSRKILERLPYMRDDHDLNRDNSGITLVFL